MTYHPDGCAREDGLPCSCIDDADVPHAFDGSDLGMPCEACGHLYGYDVHHVDDGRGSR